jgi:S-adenosylmethionine:tRNA ribosyltransferase-isomerase
MVLDRRGNKIEHRQFKDLKDYINQGDCMVFNDTKVIPARLLGHKADSGANVEFLLLDRLGPVTWECMAYPGRKLKPGAKAVFGGGVLEAVVMDIVQGGNRVVEFKFDDSSSFEEVLDKCGLTPLPPYITSNAGDFRERYQTVYSKYSGSVAAPTAGLHFTPEYLELLRRIGVRTAFLTLHVGAGTFKPVKCESIAEHTMHSERYIIGEDAADAVNRVKHDGGRQLIAVGTTSMRTLETAADQRGFIKPCEGRTDIFIYPGYKFKCADALLTNFHLPGSTLIMLVSAFAGYELTMEAYRQAIEREYRFYSFGDAMLIY